MRALPAFGLLMIMEAGNIVRGRIRLTDRQAPRILQS
jgi:hypothetical protein